MEIRRTHLGGVPAFWTEGAGKFMGFLLFRSGRSDETITWSGVNHLVEHLALPTEAPRSLEFNGTVDAITTSFWAVGPQPRVLEFLAEVTASLAALPAARLETERRILLTEASGSSVHPVQGAFALRYGAQGPGLAGFDELGLHRLGADDVTAWAAKWFTSGNAAMFLTGEPPSDLSWQLPAGERIAPAEPRPIPYLELPSIQVGSAAGMVVVAFVAERSSALRATVAIAERRARQRLRYALGVTYDVSWNYDPLSREVAHVTLWADCLPANAGEVARELVAVLDELAATGPTDDELERERDDEREWIDDSENAPSNLFYRALQELLGADFQTDEEHIAEMAAVTPAVAARALATALETMLLVVPEETPAPDGRFTPYPVSSPERVSGRSLALRGLNLGREARRTRLVVGDDGISVLTADGGAATVRFDECVAVERWASGARALWGADGFRVEVEPEAWRDGDRVVRTIDERISPTLVVPMEREVEERVAEIDVLAEAKVKRGWMTSDELRTLPALLAPGEQVVTLAQASKRWRSGVLVLTDRRLLFLYLEDLVEEVDLSAITSVDATEKTWIGYSKLGVATVDGERTYTDIKEDRLAELAAELRRRTQAG